MASPTQPFARLSLISVGDGKSAKKHCQQLHQDFAIYQINLEKILDQP